MPALSLARARALHLAAQGLLHPPRRRARPQDVVEAITRMRMLQIDSIHVVARSPYMVLFSRLGGYRQAWLEQALEEGRIVECWAHEACFVPACDHPWHGAARALRRNHWANRRAHRLGREQRRTLDALLREVDERGPLRAGDLASDAPRKSGWWEWTGEKSGLEALFAMGEVMVSRRDRFQRVYDLSSRVLERVAAHAGPPPSEPVDADAAQRRFTVDAVRALGVARAEWIGDYHRQGRVPDALLRELVERGELVRARVEGWDEPALVHAGHAPLLRRIADGRVRASHVTLLSPFDPVVWDRRRARELFDFEYALECYTPAGKRRYGYYVLPLLSRGRLIGRVDAKAHRREGVFEARGVYLEPHAGTGDATLRAVAQALRACANWHETPRVRVGRCEPSSIRPRLGRMLEATSGSA